MRLTVNGEPREFDRVENIAQLVKSLGGDVKYFSVALNGEFVARGDYEKTKLSEADDIEIVSPFPGG